jgi:hypothetical protein
MAMRDKRESADHHVAGAQFLTMNSQVWEPHERRSGKEAAGHVPAFPAVEHSYQETGPLASNRVAPSATATALRPRHSIRPVAACPLA